MAISMVFLIRRITQYHDFLVATEPLDTITGRVTYSQAILKEFGWIEEAKGRGIDTVGTGYSQI